VQKAKIQRRQTIHATEKKHENTGTNFLANKGRALPVSLGSISECLFLHCEELIYG
jgi:hypothetical protein